MGAEYSRDPREQEIRRASQLKDKGTRAFNHGDYDAAIGLFREAIEVIEQVFEEYGEYDDRNYDSDTHPEFVRMTCLLNTASALLKQGDAKGASKCCDEMMVSSASGVLSARPHLFVKAVLRKGQALLARGRVAEGVVLLRKAHDLAPTDRSISAILADAEEVLIELNASGGGAGSSDDDSDSAATSSSGGGESGSGSDDGGGDGRGLEWFTDFFDRVAEDEANRELELEEQQRRTRNRLLHSGAFGGWDPTTAGMNRMHLIRNMQTRGGLKRAHKADVLHASLPTESYGAVANYDCRPYCGSFSHDGALFFTATQDWTIHVYDTENHRPGGELVEWFSTETEVGRWTLTDTQLCSQNRFLIYSSITPNVHMVDMHLAMAARMEGRDLPPHHRLAFNSGGYGHRGGFGIWSVRFSADDREVVAGTSDASLYVCDIETETLVTSIPQCHNDDINAVCFGDESGNLLFSGSDDCVIKVWDRRSMANNQAAGVCVGHYEGLTYIDAKGDGIYIVSNGKDQTMRLWDIRKSTVEPAALAQMPRFHNRFPHWDYRQGRYPGGRFDAYRHPHDRSVVTCRGHSVVHTLIRCHFSPAATTGQRYLYTGSADGAVCAYDLGGALVAEVPVDTGYDPVVRDVAMHPSHMYMLATAWDGSLVEIGGARSAPEQDAF